MRSLWKKKVGGKRGLPRFVIIKRLAKRIEVTEKASRVSRANDRCAQLFSLLSHEPFTEMDRQVTIKLFELSINRYSDVSDVLDSSILVETRS